MKRNYPYLKDKDFLVLADTQRIQNQYIKLTLLDWNEEPLEEIQGFATGGSISVNGNSAVRRTCSVTMTVRHVSTGNITDAKNLISINKKIYVEIGIENKTPYYRDYPILWYPQGTMVLTQCSVTTDLNQGVTLSAQLKDKMCLLNGECGGVITSAVTFHEYDTLDDATGKMITIKPTISRIIRELVNHFGGEQLGKIIINDIEEKIKMTMRWTGSNPLYLATNSANTGDSGPCLFTTSEKEAEEFGGIIQEFSYGQDVGFEYTDFIWSNGELTANAGDNVCTILDKIKNYLGNYEYYYDINGNFIFQEIKNYLNTTQTTIDLKNMENKDYIIDIAKGKSVYDFSDNKLLTNLSNNPQYNKIKNDFIVWGIRENTSGNKLPIRYHLAIDTKPRTGNIYEVFFYNDPKDGLKKAKCPVKYENKSRFPETGVEGVFYLDNNTGLIYKWDGDLKEYVSLEGSNFKEYNTRDDFPNQGQEGVIYVSTSNDKMYSWTLVPGSVHYNTIASQINALTAAYEHSLRPYEQQIKDLEELKTQYQDDLDTLDNTYRKWLIQEKQYNNELDALNKQKDTIEQLISKKENDKEHYDNIVIQKNIEIANLEAEWARTTDPEEKARILQEINNAISDRDSAQTYSDDLAEDITNLQEDLIPIEASIADIEFQLAPIEEELIDYHAAADTINNHIEETDEEISDIKEIMAGLTENYTVDKTDLLAQQGEYVDYVGESLVYVQATDWRSELYLAGAAAEPLGLDSNYYYAELNAEWPKIYNLQANSYVDPDSGHTIYTGAFYDDVLNNPWDVDYWLDFIDSETAVGQFNISNIGRRSLTENKDDYNCVFEAEIPDIVIIKAGTDTTDEEREECERRNQNYSQVSPSIFDALVIGGLHNSCFNEIKNLLWEYTNYNASISLTCIPVYHLEPNTRITINSNDADIHGDFMISTFSIPLAMNGTMNISATQVQEKL